MENTFEPTVRHITTLNAMDDQTKSAIKQLVDTLGYYRTIQVLITECKKSNKEAKILADIGCYMITTEHFECEGCSYASPNLTDHTCC